MTDTKRSILREAQRLALPIVERLIEQLYNDCGPDLGWTDKTPSLREMEGVLFDLACGRATAAERTCIDLLTIAQRHAICHRIR